MAALSAAILPTVPSYDPWSWIVWGREVVDPHLSFAVSGGPSWKPLPFLFTTVFGLFGGGAPTLWVIAARAGGLLGLVAAYRLAARLVTREASAPGWAGPVAGVLAAGGLLLTQDWFYYMFRGTSEPMLIGLSLWAVDRHLAGREWFAFVLGVGASLIRPEAWPFIVVYAGWLGARDRRPLVWAGLLVGLLAIPFFWFVPPWIGSGSPFLAAQHAKAYNGHLGTSRLLTVLRRGADLQTVPVLVLALVAVGVGWWRERDRLLVALALAAAGWWVIVVGMTLDGYPGLERFYLPAAGVACVLAGVGVSRLALARGERCRERAPSWQSPGRSWWRWSRRCSRCQRGGSTRRGRRGPIAARAVTRLDQLSAAVAVLGGHRGVYPCHSSFAAVNHSVQTALAWKLHVTLGRVGTSMTHPGLMFIGPHDTIDGDAPAVSRRLRVGRVVADGRGVAGVPRHGAGALRALHRLLTRLCSRPLRLRGGVEKRPYRAVSDPAPGRRPRRRAESSSMVVLGIDPGTASTGYGVVEGSGSRLRPLADGVIRTAAGVPLERRLADIHARTVELLETFAPDAVAIEELYFGANARTAFAVGQARGVVLLAAGQRGVPARSYTPQQVKGAVCGHGRAGKEQVGRMVGRLLGLAAPPAPDHAADALAVAICDLNRAPLARALSGARA